MTALFRVASIWPVALTLALMPNRYAVLGEDFYPIAAGGRPSAAALDPLDLASPTAAVLPDVWAGQPADLGTPGLDRARDDRLDRPWPADSPSVRPGRSFSPLAEPLTESAWYARVDYFHWNERIEGADFVNEYGAVPTLGYMRRVGPERFRLELAGATVHYHGGGVFDDGTFEPMRSTTNYLGLRGEYDLLIEPPRWNHLSLLVGIGTRFWIRDLKDAYTIFGNPVIGYQETWWTIYPYLGLETRRHGREGLELYGSGRIGLTPLSYERVTLFDVTLYPKTGITGQAEAGIRGPRFFVAAFFEAMTWGQSALVRDTLQPESRMLTTGLKTGFCF
ncbi:MAG: hypothetical protein ACUVUC_02400 [Thermoguttaceae bacterium]